MNVIKAVVIIFGFLALVAFSTNAYFSDQVVVLGNQITTGNWITPTP